MDALSPGDLVARAGPLGSLSSVFHQVNELVSDPHSTITDIGRVIATDAALSARLLRVANSALYHFPAPIETVARAVTLIGTQQLRDLALATSVLARFRGVDGRLVSMDSFWRHSLACGVTARVIATFRREPHAERFFTAGLLHDIGRLLVYQQLPGRARGLLLAARERGELLYRHERGVLGFDHAAVGAALVQAWHLPESLVEPVGAHHAPERAVRYPVECAVVHAADVIANALALGSSGERFVPPLEPGAWERVGLPVSQLRQVLVQAERQYHTAVDVFLGEAA